MLTSNNSNMFNVKGKLGSQLTTHPLTTRLGGSEVCAHDNASDDAALGLMSD